MNEKKSEFGVISAIIERVVARFSAHDREEICHQYTGGKTLEQIAQKKMLKDDDIKVIISAIRILLIEDLGEVAYKKLSKGRGGKKQKQEGIGIHKQTVAEKKKMGAMGSSAMGREAYGEDEIEAVLRLSQLPENIKGTQRFHADKIAAALHEAFPGGLKRSSKGISNLLNRLKEQGRLSPIQ